jgi:ribosomal protein L10
MINEKTFWDGIFEINIKNKITGEIKKEKIHNRLMNIALQELVKPLTGTAANLEIKYLAVGTGATAVTDNDAALAAQIFRTPDTSLSANATGQVTSEFIVLDSEAVATIEEIGIFGGTSATLTANVGILISRILWHHVKTSSEEITFRRIDTLTRG